MVENKCLELVIERHLQRAIPPGFKWILQLEFLKERGKKQFENTCFPSFFQPFEWSNVIIPVILSSYNMRPPNFSPKVKVNIRQQADLFTVLHSQRTMQGPNQTLLNTSKFARVKYIGHTN